MRGKYIVPTRTCRVCSLLRFDGKKWCFSRLSDQFKPLPFPDRLFFQLVQTVCAHTMTGPSHAACNIGRDLHFRLDRYRDAALLHCITAVKIFHSTVATAAQLAVHKDSSGFEGNLIRQWHSCRFCLETCSCRLTMEPLLGDSVSSATRTTGERSLQPRIHLLHLPQHLSRLEARKSDNDNAKQQKRKIEDNCNCLQPLACAQASHSVFKQRGKGRLSAHPDGTIAVLDQTSAIFSLHNRAAGRGPYISYGRNLQTCLNRPEKGHISSFHGLP